MLIRRLVTVLYSISGTSCSSLITVYQYVPFINQPITHLKTTMMVPSVLLLTALLLLVLPSEAAPTGLRRLRKTALRVPDLNPLDTTKLKTQENNVERDAGFELVQDELEEVFFNEVFRLDLSLSFSLGPSRPDGRVGGGSTGGGGGSSAGGTPTGEVSSTPTGGGIGREINVGNSVGDVEDGSSVEPDGSSVEPGDGSAVYTKCGITKAARSERILDILSEISNRNMLTDMSTARYNARYWLDEEDKAMICPDNKERVKQRYTAALLYFQFGGDNWDNCRANGGTCFQEDSTNVPAIPFLDQSNECNWFGLGCYDEIPQVVSRSQNQFLAVDDYVPITSVDISDNSLSGEMFPELFGLTALQELTLDGNKNIRGSIPEEIGALTNLLALDIDDNALTGTLPSVLYTLTSLEAIDLNSNSLSGTISDDIGNLPNLVVVQFDNNEFSGPMPTDGLIGLEKLGKSDHFS